VRLQEFCYCDTQYKGKTEMERLRAMRDTPLPQRGEADWPSLRLENRVYRSRVFRKLHLELAFRQDGLQVRSREAAARLVPRRRQGMREVYTRHLKPVFGPVCLLGRFCLACKILQRSTCTHDSLAWHSGIDAACAARATQVLHCVMFPSHEYDLPIFGLDLVARGNQVRIMQAWALGDASKHWELACARCTWRRKHQAWLRPLLLLAMQVTLGIVDVSPASLDRSLPSIVAQTVQCAPALWS